MNPLLTPRIETESTAIRRGVCRLSRFQSVRPRHLTPQRELLDWLAEAHWRAGGVDKSAIEAQFAHYSASSDQIAVRGYELADFSHRRWDEMELFGPKGSDLAAKTKFFEARTNEIFQSYYPAQAAAPAAIVHVTCTGYASPSGAQRVVSSRNWGRRTEVVHAYHMGCYAAHPAVRIAAGLGRSDIVHTELCSLHLDPAKHDAEHLVIQSLFADGFMKYSLSAAEEPEPGEPALQILAARDEIIADSTHAMAWVTGPLNFTMQLSREVPSILAAALPRFAAALMEEAGLDWATERHRAAFAIHPGGPRIIELAQKVLGLDQAQVRWSRDVLKRHGNMSSATLPHIWQAMLHDPRLADGTVIVSIGAGPGLTLSGMVFRKHLG